VLAALSNYLPGFDEPSRMALGPSSSSVIGWPMRSLSAPSRGKPAHDRPSITGVLIAASGGATGFGLAALASYTALALYSRLRSATPLRGAAAQRVLAQFVEGLNFVGHNFVSRASFALLSSTASSPCPISPLLPIRRRVLPCRLDGLRPAECRAWDGALVRLAHRRDHRASHSSKRVRRSSWERNAWSAPDRLSFSPGMGLALPCSSWWGFCTRYT